jgi:hypothetical protein
MSRVSLRVVTAIATAAVLCPLGLIGQTLATSSPTAATSRPVQVAALDLPAVSSSSSSSAMEFDAAAAQSSMSTQAPVVNHPGAGTFSGIAVAAKIGLAGIGFDVATPIVRQRLNLRGGASFFSYTPSTITTSDGYNVNGNLKLNNAAIMADFFPFRGWFRISGGMTIYNNTGMSANITLPTGKSVTIGGTTYYSDPDPGQALTGTGSFKFGGNTAGRVTIGTGNMLPANKHFAFETEIGVQFFSQPVVSLAFTGQGCPTATDVGCKPIPTTNVAAEQVTLQNDVNDLRFFPVLSFGLSYKIH